MHQRAGGPATAGSSSCTHPRRIVGAGGIVDQGDGSGRWNLSDMRGRGRRAIYIQRTVTCMQAGCDRGCATATNGELCTASRPAAPCPKAFAQNVPVGASNSLCYTRKRSQVVFLALEKLGCKSPSAWNPSIRAPAFPNSCPVPKRGIRASEAPSQQHAC